MDDDTVVEQGGFTFCVNKELLTQIGGVTIDLTYMGFTVEPDVPLNSGASACGSCGSGGSCSI